MTEKSFNQDNKIGRERPLSPHLQVYKPQITSVLSITHRATGVALYFGVIAFGLFLYAYAFMPDIELVGWLINNDTGVFVLKAILIPYSYALYFHFCNGIRHLLWDIGFGFDIPTAYKTGYAVILFSILFTGITWIVVFLV